MPERPLPVAPGVLIIGAGPAGLSLAFELRKRGIESLLLEKGPAVAHSWAHMPTHLKLLSPWKANWLPGIDPRQFPANHAVSRAEYCSTLQNYATSQRFAVQSNASVQEVTRHDGGFRVRTTAGTFHAPLLVNATGCFANPFTPCYPGACESSLPQFHFATFGNTHRLNDAIGKRRGLVLVVGKRLSAGQLILELADAGFDVAVSSRTPIQFGAGPIGSWIFFRIYPALEQLQLQLRGNAARGVETRMPGGRTRNLIESGHVQTFPGIVQFENRRVLFNDGRSLEPDAVIYTTGFRPALGHLASLRIGLNPHDGRPALRGFESAEVSGLFFLGLDHNRNFRSRFLRGIRDDAAILADELAARRRSQTAPGSKQTDATARGAHERADLAETAAQSVT